MKKITAIEKKAKSYQVYFGEEQIEVEPEVFFKYHLHLEMELDLKAYRELIHDNEYALYFRLGIAKLKKLMTKKEMVEHLLSKGATLELSTKLVKLFEEKKYIDDFSYTKIYFQIKGKSEGPELIKNKLRNKGISPEIITGFINNYDEDSVLSELVEKKIKAIKNKSKRQAIQTIKSHFLSKGFSMDAVDRNIKKNLQYFQGNELELIEKEYAKYIRKYQSQMDAAKFNYFVTQKLYAKGFSIDDIKKVLNS